MNINMQGSVFGLLMATLAILSACGDSANGTATGFLSLNISDGPIHAANKVCVTFNEIQLKNASSRTTIALDPPEKINLLDFQGANAAPILLSQEVEAGQYQWMRLGVDAIRGTNGGADDTGGIECDGNASYIEMNDGSVYNLYVPSGENNGLKLVSGFTVPANGSADFTAEFDLMKSITRPPGLDPDVVLRPVIRLVNNVEVGTLTGQVANELATADMCEPSVFVFDDGVTPNAIDDGDVVDPEDPVATAMVDEQTNADGSVEHHYTVGFMMPGDYEVAFTCDGQTFEPTDGLPATIVVNELTTLDIGF